MNQLTGMECVCVRVGGWVWGCIFGIRMTQFEFCDNDIRVSKKFLSVLNQRPQKLEEGRYRNEAYTHFYFFIRNLLSVVVLKVKILVVSGPNVS